jgi:hypothetical protein
MRRFVGPGDMADRWRSFHNWRRNLPRALLGLGAVFWIAGFASLPFGSTRLFEALFEAGLACAILALLATWRNRIAKRGNLQ